MDDQARPRARLRRSPSARSSTARTTSIPTCRRATRSPSTTSRSASTGASSCPGEDGDHEVGIVRAHLEEDAAKTVHVGGAGGRIVGAGALARRLQPRRHAARRDRDAARPPLRRRGEALPPAAAADVVELGISDAEMEKGTLRVRRQRLRAPAGEDELRTRMGAQEHELLHVHRARDRGRGRASRSRSDEAGGEVVQETYDYDAGTGHADAAPLEGGGGRLPLLPRARPRPDRAARRAGRAAARRARRAAGRAHPAARARASASRPPRSSSRAAATRLYERVAAGVDARAAANVVMNQLAAPASTRPA